MYWVLAALAVGFAFLNGANDSGTMAASVVSSRTLSPRRAAALAAVCSFGGAMLLGSAVMRTLGQDLVRLEALAPGRGALQACLAAVCAAILWSLLSWRMGMPAAYTHALLGGWFGGFVGLAGPGSVHWAKAGGVLLLVVATPPLAVVSAWAAIRFLYWAGSELSVHTLWLFRRAEAAAFAALTFAHGANAAQKSMVLLALGLWAGPWPPEHVEVGWASRAACAGAFAAGVLLGFTRTLKTIGFGIFRVGPLHSVCALAASGSLLWASTAAGIPLSPGQVNSSALLGSGAGANWRRVRWDLAGDFFAHWVLTFPACAAASYVFAKLVQ